MFRFRFTGAVNKPLRTFFCLPATVRVVYVLKRRNTTQFVKRDNVTSSELRSVGYAGHERILEVEFQSGAIYQYFDVAPEVHEGLMAAESKGRFFNEWIRSKHPYQRKG